MTMRLQSNYKINRRIGLAAVSRGAARGGLLRLGQGRVGGAGAVTNGGSRMFQPVRTKSAIAGGLALLLCLGSGAAAAAEGAEAAIRSTLERWTEDFNGRRAAAVCGLFAPDLIASYQGQPERGYDALCRLLTASLSDPLRSYRYELRIREIIVSGDLAVVRLVWRLTIDDRSGAPPATVEEPGLDVFRRQADGTWKIIRYIAYPADRS